MWAPNFTKTSFRYHCAAHIIKTRGHGDKATGDQEPRARGREIGPRLRTFWPAGYSVTTICPIVVHAPDWEVYRTVRGVTFDLLSGRPGDTPGAVTTSTDELISCFRDGGWDSRANAGLRAAFRERFCPYDDGRAAERVVRTVFLGEPADALAPVEPARRTVPPQPGARRVSPAVRPSP